MFGFISSFIGQHMDLKMDWQDRSDYWMLGVIAGLLDGLLLGTIIYYIF